jgi:hypothetical protein
VPADPRRQHRRRHASREDAQRARREASKRWWTAERRAARSALIRRYHEEGRYPAAPPVRVWTDSERVEQGARARELWASGRLGNAEYLAVLSAHMLRNRAAGVYDDQGDWKRREWAEGRFAHLGPRIRELWRAGHAFGVGRKGLRRWRGGLKGELLARFPEERAWIEALTEEDVAGLLSTNQERDGDGAPLGDLMRNWFGEGRDRAAS